MVDEHDVRQVPERLERADGPHEDRPGKVFGSQKRGRFMIVNQVTTRSDLCELQAARPRAPAASASPLFRTPRLRSAARPSPGRGQAGGAGSPCWSTAGGRPAPHRCGSRPGAAPGSVLSGWRSPRGDALHRRARQGRSPVAFARHGAGGRDGAGTDTARGEKSLLRPVAPVDQLLVEWRPVGWRLVPWGAGQGARPAARAV
jgi:hypothetical protein